MDYLWKNVEYITNNTIECVLRNIILRIYYIFMYFLNSQPCQPNSYV